jgi:thiol-disulfide isomerase/thioredoxin
MSEELNRKEALKKEFPLLLMLGIIGLVSLIIGLGASYLRHQESSSPLPSGTYSEFLQQSWNDPNGKGIDTSSWKNKTIVINFWASWCPPCVEEMPLLAQLDTQVDPSKVTVIGIGIDSPSNIRDFLTKNPVPYPIIVGGLEGSNWAKKLGNEQGALPYTVVMNSKGEKLFSKLGKLTEDDVNKSILKAINQ